MKNLKVLVVFASILFAINLPSADASQKHRRATGAVGRQTRAPQLRDVEQFKAAFQTDAGKMRLVALVSPT
jgi:hypothetical protein